MVFSEIVGQDTCVTFLRRALTSGKLGHAYLFEGVEGCGKRLTALSLIAATFCAHHTGCGTCPVCRKVLAGQHPDLHLIEPDGAVIKIAQIRELQQELALRPYEAPRKACIIEAAERFNPASGNALLKTLEEPPGNALLILLTTNAEAVLPTIRSRCQRLRFAALGEDTISRFLVSEGVSLETARIAAAQAGGSLARAQELAAADSVATQQELVNQLFSLNLSSIKSLFSLSEKQGADRDTALSTLVLLEGLLRDMLFAQQGVEQRIFPEQRQLIEQEATRRSPEALASLFTQITATRQAIQRNVSPQLALDVLFMKLAPPRRLTDRADY
jgi:DNA polymerase-3 subunit delta'